MSRAPKITRDYYLRSKDHTLVPIEEADVTTAQVRQVDGDTFFTEPAIVGPSPLVWNGVHLQTFWEWTENIFIVGILGLASMLFVYELVVMLESSLSLTVRDLAILITVVFFAAMVVHAIQCRKVYYGWTRPYPQEIDRNIALQAARDNRRLWTTTLLVLLGCIGTIYILHLSHVIPDTSVRSISFSETYHDTRISTYEYRLMRTVFWILLGFGCPLLLLVVTEVWYQCLVGRCRRFNSDEFLYGSKGGERETLLSSHT